MRRLIISAMTALAGVVLSPFAAMAQNAAPTNAVPAPDLKAVAAYTGLKDSLPVKDTLENYIRSFGADAAAQRVFQGKLLALLKEADTTPQAKSLILLQVQRMGYCSDPAAVTSLLTDESLGQMARVALEGIQDRKVDDFLLAALSKSSGAVKVGLVQSLGMRRCAKAVTVLAPLAAGSDPAPAGAALTALGRIGTGDAVKVLQKPSASKDLEVLRFAALAAGIENLRTDGETSDAVKAAAALFADRQAPPPSRAAALATLMRADSRKTSDWFARGMSDEALKVREAATRVAAGEGIDGGLTAAIVSALPAAQPEDQVRLLGALRQRGDTKAASAVAGLLSSTNAPVPVRQAAAATLIDIGGPEQVPALLSCLAVDGVKEAALHALNNMRAAGCDKAIAKLAAGADPQLRAQLVGVLAARAGKDMLPVLVTYSADDDAGVRQAAWKALRERARPDDVDGYLDLLFQCKAEDRANAERALIATVRPMAPADRAAKLVAAWGRASVDVRPSLARVMSDTGDEACAEPLIAALDDSNDAVQEAAARALSKWPDAKPMDALLRKAPALKSDTLRLLALQGGVRMMGMKPGADPKAVLADLVRKMPDDSGRAAAAGLLGDKLGFDAFPVLEGLFGDAQVGTVAKKTYVELYGKLKDLPAGELDPKTWKATASDRSDGTGNAFDRKEETRWDTGRSQAPGMWFTLDLGQPTGVAELRLDTKRSGGDAPKGYRIYSSLDGQNWIGPILEGADAPADAVFTFPSPVAARWIKIEQTGEKPGLFWSIHELYVKSGVDASKLEPVAKKVQELQAAK